MKSEFTLGLSPCPNDCFIFYALIHEKIPLHGLSFRPLMLDVEELNQRAYTTPPEICKLSYYTLIKLNSVYAISSSGGALGKGNGPLLVSRDYFEDTNQYQEIMVPGENTTAHFLFQFAFPNYKNTKKFLRYDRIEDYVLKHPSSAGVLIHETRFMYADRGLCLRADLGQIWEKITHLPIPLGGIGISRKLPPKIQRIIPELIRESIRYAYAHPHEVMKFMKQHARELNEEIIQKHVETFVNNYSIALGNEGKQALAKMSELLEVGGGVVILE